VLAKEEVLLAKAESQHRLELCALTSRELERSGVVMHTSAYVSIRQHTSAYVSIRQHTLTSRELKRSGVVVHVYLR
jgi:hypothetical protein